MSRLARVSSTSSVASASVVDSGLSQMTSIRFEERFCDREMQVVRGDDDRGLYAVWARRLADSHFAIVRVGPLRRKTEVGARRARVFGVRRQGAGFQLDQIVEPHGHAMNRADECVTPAADHPDAQASALKPIDGGRVNHRFSL
jgi:hypothetical protein